MKKILFVERDQDLNDSVLDFAASHPEDFHVTVLKTLAEAASRLHRERFDGVIVDAVDPHIRDVVDFVRDARHHDFNLPILALAAYSDMILNESLKESLKKERVSFVNKLEALKTENFSLLFEACCNRGLGEEIKLYPRP